MRGGYESLVWLNDKNGKEYVCYIEDVHGNTNFDDLNEEERKACEDVNQLIGTERW